MEDELKAMLCFVSPIPARRNKIKDWHAGLTVQERADADAFIKANAKEQRRMGDAGLQTIPEKPF